jgi:hypothetical protein
MLRRNHLDHLHSSSGLLLVTDRDASLERRSAVRMTMLHRIASPAMSVLV